MNKTKKNMVIFLLGKFVSLMGTRIYGFAMGLYILKVTGSALSFAISILLSTVPALIFGPIGGVLADKIDRKKMVLFTDFISGVIMFIAFALSRIYGLQLWIIYISTVFLSIFDTLFSTSFDASLSNIVDDENLGKINSFNQSINSLTAIISPLIGGIIYALISPMMFMMFNGISFVLSTISEYFIDFYWKIGRNKEKIIKENNIFSDIIEGFMYLKNNNILIILLTVVIFVNFLFTAINIAVPHLIVVQYGMTEESFGIIQAGFAAGALFISIIYANKVDELKPIRISLYIMIMGIIQCLFSVPLIIYNMYNSDIFVTIFYFVLFFVLGCLNVNINIPVLVYIQRSTDDEYRGRVLALTYTFCTAISPIGYVLHGLLIDKIPTVIIILYSGIGTLLLSLLLLSKFKNYEKIR